MMKTELMMLLALIAVCANSISGQATIPVAEVDQILTNPDQYNGTILALHGIAGTHARCTFVPTDGLRRKSTVCGLKGPIPSI